MSTVLDSVDADLKTIEEAAVAQYRQTVSDVATGKKVDATTLSPLLAAASKTLDGFRKDVEKVQRRNQAVKDMQEADALAPAIEEARLKHSTMSQELETFRADTKAQIEGRSKAVATAYRTYRQDSDRADRLRRDAANTLRATVPHIMASIGELEESRSKVSHELTESSMHLARLQSLFKEEEAARIRRATSSHLSAAEASILQREHVRPQSLLAAESSVSSARQRIAEIDNKIADLRESISDPGNW